MKKFRVWDKKQREFLELEGKQITVSQEGELFVVEEREPIKELVVKYLSKDRYEINWRTHFIDKNGTPMYEEDLIKHSNQCKAFWEEELPDYYIEPLRLNENNEYVLSGFGGMIMTRHCEVVGTTYQNPELVGEN